MSLIINKSRILFDLKGFLNAPEGDASDQSVGVGFLSVMGGA